MSGSVEPHLKCHHVLTWLRPTKNSNIDPSYILWWSPAQFSLALLVGSRGFKEWKHHDNVYYFTQRKPSLIWIELIAYGYCNALFHYLTRVTTTVPFHTFVHNTETYWVWHERNAFLEAEIFFVAKDVFICFCLIPILELSLSYLRTDTYQPVLIGSCILS